MTSTPVKQSRNPVLRRFEHGVVSKNTNELKILCLPFIHPRARNLISLRLWPGKNRRLLFWRQG